jgi:hypothetical protein
MNITNNLIADYSGEGLLFTDTTGTTAPDSYGKGSNINYTDVDYYSLLIATMSSVENVTTLNAGNIFLQNVRYICVTGSSLVIDGKTFSSGDYFIPRTSGLTVPAGGVFRTTGEYLYVPNSFNPTVSLLYQVPTTLSLTEINQSGSTKVSDDVYILNYNIYNDLETTTQAAVAYQTYICVSGTTNYNGATYRAGESFTAIATTNITTTGSFAKLYTSKTTYFTIVYNMLVQLFDIQLASQGADISYHLTEIRVELEALQFSCYTGNVSFTYAKKLLDMLQGKLTYLQSIT